MIRSLLAAVAMSMVSDPAALFAAERDAVGGAWSGIAQITERGTYDTAGTPAVPYVSYVDTRTGFSKFTLGKNGETQQGFDAAGSWQAGDGLVEPVEDAGTVASARTAAYIARNGWWNPKGDPAALTFLGRKTVDAGTFDVVRVVPKGGDAVEVWLDPETHLIRSFDETNQSNVTTSTFFSDYRLLDGVRYPYTTVVVTGNDPKTAQNLRVTSVAFSKAVSAADLARPENKRTGSIAGGTSTVVPFELDNPDKGHIIVLVRVNNSRPLRMIFDTGGSNIVTDTVAREIGLKATGSTTAGGAGEGQVTVGTVSGATLRLGDATMTSQPFGIFPLPQSLVHVNGRRSIDGIVGYEILKNFVVSIDYLRRTITLTDPAAFDGSKAGTAIAFASATVPVIPVTYDGVAGAFMFDTGNAFYNTVSLPFLQSHGLGGATPGTTLVQSSGNLGGALRPWLVRAKQIQIGPYRIDRPVFAVTNTQKGSLAGTTFSGNISESIISRFDVALDYAHGLIYLKPNAAFDAPYRGSLDGMSLYETDAGMLAVSYVNPGSPAATAGILVGDVIAHVQGVAEAHPGQDDLLSIEKPGGTLHLTYLRDGKTHEAAIELAEIVP